LAGADHAQGDLPAIGNKNLLEHAVAGAAPSSFGLVQDKPCRLSLRLRSGQECGCLARTGAAHPALNDPAECCPSDKKRHAWRALSLAINLAHFRCRMANSSCPYSIGCPLATSLFTTSPATSDSISFISFMASTMHNTCPTSTKSPTFTNGGAPGEGAS